MNKLKVIFVFIFLLQPYSNCFSGEEDSLTYTICRENLLEANVKSVNGSKNSFYVLVKLTEQATEDFGNFTGENIGNRLEVLHQNSIFTGAVIKGEISSGTMMSKTMSEHEAMNLKKKLLNSKSMLHCGSNKK